MKRRGGNSAPIHDVAARLAALLPEPNGLIGALAVAAHGYVRATDDVDFISPLRSKEIQARLRDGGIDAKIRRGDPLEGDLPAVVHGEVDGVPFEVLVPPVPVDWKKLVTLSLEGGVRVRVVDLDTLVRLKLRAAGPQDLLDVVHLVRLHPEILEKARSLADAYGVRERFEEWLRDPRIREPRRRRNR